MCDYFKTVPQVFLNLKHCLTEHPSVEQNILKLK